MNLLPIAFFQVVFWFLHLHYTSVVSPGSLLNPSITMPSVKEIGNSLEGQKETLLPK